MRHYGIIGYPLHHSFSARYFNEKFEREHIDAEYSLYSIDEHNADQMRKYIDNLDGVNITFPYKRKVIPLLDRLDETATEIGAVNVVHNGIGYNTDCIGFMNSLQPLLRRDDQRALVLGTGGAARAVCYGLKKMGISHTLVSRISQNNILCYADLTREVMNGHTIIVNCTPLGMLPDVDSCPPIPYEYISARHLLFDCVYNPAETLFLYKGKAKGAATRNGMEMLIGQAEAAWKIWNS
ncbi:MAG: shikimate dehydrogenase [Paludibacteraceae bacterium]|nr:shikimate dehydrogenase [Paludibacteraceae bacterium]